MDVFLKPYRRKVAVAPFEWSRCGEPGALLLFTFIGPLDIPIATLARRRTER
jgi:hypothetical protein